jgi:putative phosphoesterase
MKRVAVLADVHGNVPALEAVLAEVEADAIVCCGDVSLGAMPVEALALMREAGALFVRGNCDRDPGDWVREQLPTEAVEFLAGLPLTVELGVEELGRVLCCHATPRSDEEIITQITPDDQLAAVLEGVDTDVVVCGHTHVQFERRIAGRRLVNAGSVGLPYEGRPGAYWVALGPDVEHRRTQYDVEAAAVLFERSGHPSGSQLAVHLREPPTPDEVTAHFESLRAA